MGCAGPVILTLGPSTYGALLFAMNYYPFNVGDYAVHTAHLEPMEDLAYRRMLDLYYLTEKPLPADPAVVARLIRMRDQLPSVQAVLEEFFTLDPDAGWRKGRCDEEIAAATSRRDKAAQSAALRWGNATGERKKRGKAATAEPAQSEGGADGEHSESERNANAMRTQSDPNAPNPNPNPNPNIPLPSGNGLGDADPPPTYASAKDEIWAAGKSLLAEAGLKREQCGSFIGGLVKTHGEEVVLEVVRAGIIERPADPVSWLKAACVGRSTPHKRGKHADLARRNAEVLAAWKPPADTFLGEGGDDATW